jgi:hypothetical protein
MQIRRILDLCEFVESFWRRIVHEPLSTEARRVGWRTVIKMRVVMMAIR